MTGHRTPWAFRVNGESPAEGSADSPAAHLRWLRATLRLSQEQLAHQLGVSFATVQLTMSGTHSIPGAVEVLKSFTKG